ncbi:hypothetical protein BDZ85DRAFT_52692 [Elsinoe ampelina]|uniref:Uncharacterized protein n=1 Tax=Elsinoe ampelina TaxID=302913 RepID=A0A6A6GLJ9_9PEZI|nr:hypothetical protein BDZ85DRAFT_52692 [Elsinoe ampelina]
MTTVNQDYAPHRARRSHSPHLPPIQDSQSQQATINDQWTHAWRELQQQVHHNTVSLEAQRSHISELHDAMRSLHSEVGSIWKHLEAVRDEVQTRLDVVRPEKQDVDVLTQHLQTVDRKASEIDGLKVQLEIMTQRLRRLEEQQQTAGPPIPLNSYHQQGPPHAYTTQQPHGTPSSEYRASQPAPPAERPPPSQQQQQHHSEPRRDEYTTGSDVRSVPGFRALDPSSGVTSWRAASALATGQHPAVPHEAAAPAPHHDVAHSSGWAAVNANHSKRPASIDATAHDASAPASPKRQKLATLMPRSSIGEVNAAYPHPDSSQLRRAGSGDSQAHFPGAPVAGQPIKFVPFPPNVEAAEAQQEAWRAEHAAAEAARGRARGARSRGRGRKSGSVGDRDDMEMRQEYARSDWGGSQDGYHRQPHHAYAMSPQDPQRGRDIQPASYPPADNASQYSGGAPETPSPAFQDSGKKSRTKPTRNANGILIRKDGRPDMRSISSAQNLRKVHAKKEAERNGEMADPTSATSSNPNSAHNDDKSSVVDGSVTESPSREAPRNFKQEKMADGDTQMADSVMMDRAEVQTRERQEMVPEMARVEPAGITA